jgi:hypothetical protein
MNNTESLLPDWQVPVAENFERHPSGRCLLVLMPEYRPDLVHSLASSFNLDFYDYRMDKMAPLGQEAGALSLDELSETLHEKTRQKATLAFNVEALMATKSEQQRVHWLSSALETQWPNTLLIPLVIFQQDAPAGHSQILDLLTVTLPEQNLINRLAM